MEIQCSGFRAAVRCCINAPRHCSSKRRRHTSKKKGSKLWSVLTPDMCLLARLQAPLYQKSRCHGPARTIYTMCPYRCSVRRRRRVRLMLWPPAQCRWRATGECGFSERVREIRNQDTSTASKSVGGLWQMCGGLRRWRTGAGIAWRNIPLWAHFQAHTHSTSFLHSLYFPGCRRGVRSRR